MTGDNGSDELRVLGVSVEQIADPRNKWAGLHAALGERFDTVGTVLAPLPPAARYALLARHVRRDRDAWRVRAGSDPRAFFARSRALERPLAAREGRYDVIVQYQTIFQLGRSAAERPFVIYTDWTFALGVRHRMRRPPTTPRVDARRLELEAQTAHMSRHVFTLSELTRRSFIDDYGCDEARVTAVGGGANALSDTPRERSGGAPTALFVGFDFERKGGDALLTAWPQVRRRVPDAQLVIAGPPARPDAGDGIRWLGPVARDDVAALYRSATVFVLPSLLEPWGFVFHEAMGQGVACIGARTCAMPEIIAEGETGRLVAPGDADDLAAALTGILEDGDLAWRLGEEARRRVLAHHTWGAVAERIRPGLIAAAGA